MGLASAIDGKTANHILAEAQSHEGDLRSAREESSDDECADARVGQVVVNGKLARLRAHDDPRVACRSDRELLDARALIGASEIRRKQQVAAVAADLGHETVHCSRPVRLRRGLVGIDRGKVC